MLRKHSIKLIILLVIFLSLNSITAISVNIVSKSTVSVGETFTVTINFGTYIGAYDSYELIYNDNVLEYVSGDVIKDNLWFDTSDESKGINKMTYTFRSKKDGYSSIKIKAKGVVSANKTMDELGDIDISKVITVGKGAKKGDVNQDGNIDPIDASFLLDKYKYSDILDEDYILGDMNGDNNINPIDASMILDVYKGV